MGSVIVAPPMVTAWEVSATEREVLRSEGTGEVDPMRRDSV